MQILTTVSWWTTLEINLDYILSLIFLYELSDLGTELETQLRTAIAERDQDTALEVLQATWASAPDVESIHDRPKWEVLCDLLSESWVFSP